MASWERKRGRKRVRGDGEVVGGRLCGGRAAAENGKDGEQETEEGDRREHGRGDMT